MAARRREAHLALHRVCYLARVPVWLIIALLVQGAAVDPAAVKLSEEGKRAFTERRYADAARTFELLHEKTGLPEYLFNIATCYRLLGRCAPAKDAYLRYLAALPRASNRPQVEEHLANLGRCVEERDVVVAGPADAGVAEVRAESSNPVRESANPGLSSGALNGAPAFSDVSAARAQRSPARAVAGGVLTGVAVAAVATAAGFLVSGWLTHQQASAAGVPALQAEQLDGAAHQRWAIGLSVGAGSLALLLAGILTLALPTGAGESRHQAVLTAAE